MDKRSEINFTNIMREIRIIELNNSLEDDKKFGFILTNASDKLKDFILKNNINSIESLSCKISSLELARKSIDDIINECTKQRGSIQDPMDYIQEISENLMAFGASENAIIKVLSYNIWPRAPNEIKEELLKANSLRDLRNTVQENSLKAKNKKKNKTQKAI